MPVFAQWCWVCFLSRCRPAPEIPRTHLGQVNRDPSGSLCSRLVPSVINPGTAVRTMDFEFQDAALRVAPDVTIASVMIDLPRVFLEVTRQVRTGKFIPRVISLGLHDDVVRLVLNPRMSAVIPEKIRTEVDSVRTALINGTLKLPHAQ